MWTHGVRILLHDVSLGLFAISKPPGVLSHPNPRRTTIPVDKPQRTLKSGGAQPAALLPFAYSHEEEAYIGDGDDNGDDPGGKGERFHLISRLDSATSGILLLTTRKDIAVHIKQLLREKQVSKKYVAVVVKKSPELFSSSSISDTSGSWTDPIRVDNRWKSAHTIVRSVDKYVSDDFSMLELNAVTGRTHQLRIHCAQHQLPILGDRTHGNFAWNRSMQKIYSIDKNRLFLHCHQLQFLLKVDAKEHWIQVDDPVPESFLDLFD